LIHELTLARLREREWVRVLVRTALYFHRRTRRSKAFSHDSLRASW
jgi:hypothetical protein